MSLPRYVVNLPDLLNIIKDAMTDSDDITSKVQRSIGFMINSNANEVNSVKWVPDEDIGIIGLRFGQEDIRNMGYSDYFNVAVDGELMLDNIYHKELNEQKWFRAPFLVAKDTEVIITNSNKSGIDKEVKYDIDYIEATIPQKEVIIVCKNKENGNVIERFSQFYKPVYQGQITPPEIDGYETVSEPKQINIRVSTSSPLIVEFYYDALEVPEIPSIGHLYDWKLVLRWEGRVSTDLDFHAIYDGNEIYYGNREDVDYNENEEPLKGVWLDHDFTNHSGANDRLDKPEIMTILGSEMGVIQFFVRNYRAGSELTEEVTVDIYKFNESGDDELIQSVSKDPSLFHQHKADVDIATINTIKGDIVLH